CGGWAGTPSAPPRAPASRGGWGGASSRRSPPAPPPGGGGAGWRAGAPGPPDAGAALAASAGMALFPRDGDDAESLLRAVDVALRVAKRTGVSQLSVYAGDPIVGRRPARGGTR